jgi:hypothetical protein
MVTRGVHDDEHLFAVQCLNPTCAYEAMAYSFEEGAIHHHNENVVRLKVMLVEVWNMALRHANHPEVDEFDEWLKQKGLA